MALIVWILIFPPPFAVPLCYCLKLAFFFAYRVNSRFCYFINIFCFFISSIGHTNSIRKKLIFCDLQPDAFLCSVNEVTVSSSIDPRARNVEIGAEVFLFSLLSFSSVLLMRRLPKRYFCMIILNVCTSRHFYFKELHVGYADETLGLTLFSTFPGYT